jgi:hypothetical protein
VTVARPLPGFRLLFAVGAVLVILGGTQLFFFPERTDEYFAWTIASPLTAATDGAFFFTGFVLFAAALRATTWADARPLAYAVLVVSSVKLIATLLDLDPFHFEGPGTLAQIAAWSWLIVYIVVPVGLAGLLIAQRNVPGGDPPPGPPIPRALAAAFGVIAGVMVGTGALQLFAADVAIDVWPWPLTPLTSHALSAWFLGVGLLAALVVRENDLPRAGPAMLGAAVLAVLLAIALLRFESEMDWDRALAWVYVGLIGLLFAAGAAGLTARARSAGPSASPR